jgi:hypothetical protein
MKTNRHKFAFLSGVCLLAVCVSACTPTPPTGACVAGAGTRTQGCDEFTRLIARLYMNGTEHTAGGWHPLDTGDTLETDPSGEAELNFSDCWDGRLYLFENGAGNIRVRDCRKADYDSVSNLCIPNGSWYSGKCRGEFSATTSSVRLTKLGTSFSITALPENREISLVVVLEGEVLVEPVLSYEPTKLGPSDEVAGGHFYFTMPDAMLSDVAGLEPRVQHPVEKLGPVAEELGTVDWMFDVRNRAGQEDVLPPNWPPELGGEARPPTEPPTEPPLAANGFVVTSGGVALNDPRVQEAMLRAVDWQTAGPSGAPDGGKVVAFVGDKPVDPISDLAYDPEKSEALLEEAGYKPDQPLLVLHPAGDQPLEKVAHLVARDLGMLGIKAVVQAVPAAELEKQASARMQAGEPVIALSR